MQGFKRPNHKRRRQKAKQEELERRRRAVVDAEIKYDQARSPAPVEPGSAAAVLGDPVLGAVLGALHRIRASKQG